MAQNQLHQSQIKNPATIRRHIIKYVILSTELSSSVLFLDSRFQTQVLPQLITHKNA